MPNVHLKPEVNHHFWWLDHVRSPSWMVNPSLVQSPPHRRCLALIVCWAKWRWRWSNSKRPSAHPNDTKHGHGHSHMWFYLQRPPWFLEVCFVYYYYYYYYYYCYYYYCYYYYYIYMYICIINKYIYIISYITIQQHEEIHGIVSVDGTSIGYCQRNIIYIVLMEC
jgi:hypothetical protein